MRAPVAGRPARSFTRRSNGRRPKRAHPRPEPMLANNVVFSARWPGILRRMSPTYRTDAATTAAAHAPACAATAGGLHGRAEDASPAHSPQRSKRGSVPGRRTTRHVRELPFSDISPGGRSGLPHRLGERQRCVGAGSLSLVVHTDTAAAGQVGARSATRAAAASACLRRVRRRPQASGSDSSQGPLRRRCWCRAPGMPRKAGT